MSTVIELAHLGALVGDPTRANMLSALFDGTAHTAKDLACAAGVTPQTASWHLALLADGRLVFAERRGRNRHYRLASPQVAFMLETMMGVAASVPRRPRAPSRPDDALRAARTCYDHLAGKLGVGVADALAGCGHLILSDDGAALTASGADALAAFGIDLSAPRRKRVFCRPCLDWSERRPHLAGAVGASIAARCFELGWVERVPGGRALRITEIGRAGFADRFGLAV